MDGFFAAALIAGLIFSGFGYVGSNGVARAVNIPPVIEGPPCPTTSQATGRVQFWRDDRGYGFIKSDDGERVYALWHKLTAGQQLRAGQHVMFDKDYSRKGGKAAAVNLTVCGG